MNRGPKEELIAQLAQVEADAAEMRMLIEEVKQVSNALSRQFDMRYLLGRCESILSIGSGQRLLDELATLRATAQRRLELLRKVDQVTTHCIFCCCGTEGDDHSPDCPLAAALKEGK